jgi:hypothetical protein
VLFVCSVVLFALVPLGVAVRDFLLGLGRVHR